jgi:phage protein D
MLGSYQIMINGQSADSDLYTAIASVEVEESMDMPAALQLTLPVTRNAQGALSHVDDGRFAPMSNIAVVTDTGGGNAQGALGGALGAASAALGGTSASTTQCIFDGYVLSQRLHVETGITKSSLEVWGQDASWLMNLTEQAKEWVDVTDGAVANSIFGDYGITPADENLDDDSPTHTEDGHSLMQRASDIQFLRALARRNGKVCRVACADKPGVRTGYFAKPKLDGDPVVTLTLNDPEHWTVGALNLEWDATRATSVVAREATFDDPSDSGVSADTTDSGLKLLGDQDLATFTGKPLQVMLTTVVDDVGELQLRAAALLREALWFVRCEGDADVERLGTVLRAGMIVAVAGLGSLYSGNYLVWSVRHSIKPDSHVMKFVLLRNAVGASGGAASSGLPSLPSL